MKKTLTAIFMAVSGLIIMAVPDLRDFIIGNFTSFFTDSMISIVESIRFGTGS